jgi:hypothetical protein
MLVTNDYLGAWDTKTRDSHHLHSAQAPPLACIETLPLTRIEWRQRPVTTTQSISQAIIKRCGGRVLGLGVLMQA